MPERITKAAQARKFIGKKVRWRKRWHTDQLAQVDILHEVSGKNVALATCMGLDWQWLPDIHMELVEGE